MDTSKPVTNRKKAGFWKDAETLSTLRLYVDGKLTEEQATSRLECGPGDVKYYAARLSKAESIKPKAAPIQAPSKERVAVSHP